MKNIFISGVSSGLGLAIAQKYLDMGWRVYGISRRPCPLMEVRWSPADLLSGEEVEAVLKDLLPVDITLDLVVLNAGRLGAVADLNTVAMADLKQTMDVNLWSNKVIVDTLFDHVKSIDQVVAISSGASVSGNRGWNGYALSKAALNMMMQLYAAEFQKSHFIAFAPGLVDTAMQDTICAIKDTEGLASIQRIQQSRGTEVMPTPEALASRLPEVFVDLRQYASGAFIDIRKM